QSHLESADAALAEGRLRRAVEEFSKARELALQRPDVLSAAQHRALLQRHREASLVADLLSESLDEILLRAARSPEEEWKAQFEKRYRGPGQANAVIFDAEVRRDAAGSYHVDWDLKPGDEPARLDINDLAVLHDLPLNEPRRLLFGARLGSIAREQNGVWVVRFDPSSGVLLTDPHVVAACYPAPGDDTVRPLLEQQKAWTEERGHSQIGVACLRIASRCAPHRPPRHFEFVQGLRALFPSKNAEKRWQEHQSGSHAASDPERETEAQSG